MGAGRRLWAVALVVMGAEASLSGTVCLGAAAADRVAVSGYDNSYDKSNTLTDWMHGVVTGAKTLVTAKNSPFTAETPRDVYAIPLRVKADAEGRVRLKLSAQNEAGIAWLEIKAIPLTGFTLLIK